MDYTLTTGSSPVLDYLKENIALTVVLAIILVLILALIITMIVLAVAGKKRRAAEAEAETPAEEAPAEEAPAEETPAEEAPAKEEPAEEAPETEAPAAEEAPAEETPAEEAPKQEEAPEPKTAPAAAAPVAAEKDTTAKEEPVAAKKEPAPKKEPAKKESAANPYGGKWVITQEGASFSFELRASNGEKMLGSGEYTSLSGAKTGIETYKKNIDKGNFKIVQTKTGDFIFQLLNARGGLLALGADYKTRARCESAIESTKRFAATAAIEIVPAE